MTTPVLSIDTRISIHALREESDHTVSGRHTTGVYFNPRSP